MAPSDAIILLCGSLPTVNCVTNKELEAKMMDCHFKNILFYLCVCVWFAHMCKKRVLSLSCLEIEVVVSH